MSTNSSLSGGNNVETAVGNGQGFAGQKFTIVPQGTVPEFNPKKEKWIDYKERFEIACELHGIVDKKMERSLLIGALSPETYRKVRISAAPKDLLN
uniref:Transposase n=1 Tax=Strongyloides papillosus TaxID=174720 RepID=A0A0N5BN49_STREA